MVACCCFCFFPYGAIGVTVLYGAFCFMVLSLLGTECPQGECRTEGVDNAPIAWMSNVFIAIAFLMLGVHILFMKRQGGSLCRAFLAFLAMSISHVLWAMVGHSFGNDGTKDGLGNRGYFILNMLAYIFAADAMYEVTGLAIAVWRTILPEYQSSICCGRTSLRIYEVFLGITILIIASGCLWCSSTDEIVVSTTLDQIPNDLDDIEVHTCIQMVDIGQVVFTAVSALFWIAVASIYGASARQQIFELDKWYFVWGMPTSLAAAAVICFQTTIFVFHLMAFLLQRSAESEPDESIATTASIAYHYCILMTGFFAHNFLSEMSIGRNVLVHQINKRKKKTRNSTTEGDHDNDNGDGGDDDDNGDAAAASGEEDQQDDTSHSSSNHSLSLKNIMIVPSFSSGATKSWEKEQATGEQRPDPPVLETEKQTKKEPPTMMSSLMDDHSSTTSGAGSSSSSSSSAVKKRSLLPESSKDEVAPAAVVADDNIPSTPLQQQQPSPQPIVFCGWSMDHLFGGGGTPPPPATPKSTSPRGVDPFQGMEQGLAAPSTTSTSTSACSTPKKASSSPTALDSTGSGSGDDAASTTSTDSPPGVFSWLSSMISEGGVSPMRTTPPATAAAAVDEQRNDQDNELKEFDVEMRNQALDSPSTTAAAAPAPLAVEAEDVETGSTTRSSPSPTKSPTMSPSSRPRKAQRRGSVTKYSLDDAAHETLQLPSLSSELKELKETFQEIEHERGTSSNNAKNNTQEEQPSSSSILSGLGTAIWSVLENGQQVLKDATATSPRQRVDTYAGMMASTREESVAASAHSPPEAPRYFSIIGGPMADSPHHERTSSTTGDNDQDTIRTDACVVLTTNTEQQQEQQEQRRINGLPPSAPAALSTTRPRSRRPPRQRQASTMVSQMADWQNNPSSTITPRANAIPRSTTTVVAAGGGSSPAPRTTKQQHIKRSVSTPNRSMKERSHNSHHHEIRQSNSMTSAVDWRRNQTTTGRSSSRNLHFPPVPTTTASGNKKKKQTASVVRRSSSLISGPRTIAHDDDDEDGDSSSATSTSSSDGMMIMLRQASSFGGGRKSTTSAAAAAAETPTTLPQKQRNRLSSYQQPKHKHPPRSSALLSGPRTITRDDDDDDDSIHDSTSSSSGSGSGSGDARDDAVAPARRRHQRRDLRASS